MLPKTHFIWSVALAIILGVLGFLDLFQALAFVFGGVLIDTDHWLWFVFNKKSFSLKKAYKWHYKLYINRVRGNMLQIFHTIESFAVIVLLTFVHPIFFYVFLGMAFHLLLDLVQAYDHGFYGKEVSLIYYLIKK